MSQPAESTTVAAGCPGTVLVSHDIWFPKGRTPCTQNTSMYPGKAKRLFFVIFVTNCKTHEWMNFGGWGFFFLYLASFSLNTGCNDCSENGDKKTNANSLKKWNASGIFCIAAHKWHEDLIVDWSFLPTYQSCHKWCYALFLHWSSCQCPSKSIGFFLNPNTKTNVGTINKLLEIFIIIIYPQLMRKHLMTLRLTHIKIWVHNFQKNHKLPCGY